MPKWSWSKRPGGSARVTDKRSARSPSKAGGRRSSRWRTALRRVLDWTPRTHRQRATHRLWARDVQTHLGFSNQALEGVFLRFGSLLQPLSEHMEDLIRSRDQLVSFASGRVDGKTIFEEAVSLLHGPLQHIETLVARHAELLKLLTRCEEQTEHMLGSQQEVASMLAPLAYVEVLFKIESAGLDHDTRDTFLTVAHEIGHLRQLVDKTFQENAERLRVTHRTLAEVRAGYETDIAKHARHIDEVQRKIQDSILRLDDDLMRNSHLDAQTRELSEELRARVGKVVTALQFQDIIQQKSQHLGKVLQAIETDGAASGQMVQLTHNQLVLTVRELTRAEKEIAHGLSGVIEQAEAIERRCIEESGFDGMIAAADGMVQMILDSLVETQEVLDHTNGLIDRSYSAAKPAGEVLQSVSAAVGELSIQMRLIAINAQVRSAQITEGTGLSTLAAHTALISSQIIKIGEVMAGDIGTLRQATSALFEIFDTFQEGGQSNATHLREKRVSIEERLHSLRDRTLEVFNAVGESVNTIRQSSGEVGDCVSQLGRAGARLRRAQKIVEAVRSEHGMLDDRPSASHARVLSDYARTYSMQSERQVHAATLRGEAPPTLLAADHGAPELFGPVEPAPVARRPAAARPQAAPSAPPQTPSPSAPESFGDNVDLF